MLLTTAAQSSQDNSFMPSFLHTTTSYPHLPSATPVVDTSIEGTRRRRAASTRGLLASMQTAVNGPVDNQRDRERERERERDRGESPSKKRRYQNAEEEKHHKHRHHHHHHHSSHHHKDGSRRQYVHSSYFPPIVYLGSNRIYSHTQPIQDEFAPSPHHHPYPNQPSTTTTTTLTTTHHTHHTSHHHHTSSAQPHRRRTAPTAGMLDDFLGRQARQGHRPHPDDYDEDPDMDEEILEEGDDPEKVYCICGTISWGEMLGCDDEDCRREWVRFSPLIIPSPHYLTDVCLPVPSLLSWTRRSA